MTIRLYVYQENGLTNAEKTSKLSYNCVVFKWLLLYDYYGICMLMMIAMIKNISEKILINNNSLIVFYLLTWYTLVKSRAHCIADIAIAAPPSSEVPSQSIQRDYVVHLDLIADATSRPT